MGFEIIFNFSWNYDVIDFVNFMIIHGKDKFCGLNLTLVLCSGNRSGMATPLTAVTYSISLNKIGVIIFILVPVELTLLSSET